jgi:hypothetical protein
MTNLAYYYAGTEIAPGGEHVVVISGYPETQLRTPEPLNDIIASLDHYGKIPEDV